VFVIKKEMFSLRKFSLWFSLIEKHRFTHYGVPQTHESVLEISRTTGIHWMSVGRFMRDLVRATKPEETTL